MRDLDGDDGTVFMWSHHENTILNAIARQLKEDDNPPDDRDDLMELSGEPDEGRRSGDGRSLRPRRQGSISSGNQGQQLD